MSDKNMNFNQAHELLGGDEGTREYGEDGRRWLEGLLLIKKYRPEFGTGYNLHAEHDILYVNDFIEEMTEEDVKQLARWGFHLDSDAEGWALFT